MPHTSKGCCEKCLPYHLDYSSCIDSDCPCHAPQGEKKCCDYCVKGLHTDCTACRCGQKLPQPEAALILEIRLCGLCGVMTNHQGDFCLKCEHFDYPSSPTPSKSRLVYCDHCVQMTDWIGNTCQKCLQDLSLPTPSKDNSWESQFDKEFGDEQFTNEKDTSYDFAQDPIYNHIKSFISKAIEQARKEGKVEGISLGGQIVHKMVEQAKVEERGKTIQLLDRLLPLVAEEQNVVLHAEIIATIKNMTYFLQSLTKK